MELEVLDIKGNKTGKKRKLSKDIFAIDPNEHTIYLDVKRFLSNRRQGTHKTKERGEIKGSTRKIKKQKGTGTARAGSVKSPLFVGGGTVFGPRPRKYTLKVNKVVKRLARISALTIKARDKAIFLIEDFDINPPKTKNLLEVLKSLGLEDKKTIFLLGNTNNGLHLSSRNLKGISAINASCITTYDIVNANSLVFLESSLDKIEENLR